MENQDDAPRPPIVAWGRTFKMSLEDLMEGCGFINPADLDPDELEQIRNASRKLNVNPIQEEDGHTKAADGAPVEPKQLSEREPEQ